ncbi:MAG: hypothetical protein R3D98_17905 [Candidatus Krumholzibacteriia bacterium]
MMRKTLLILLALLVSGLVLAKDELPKPLVPSNVTVRADEAEPNDDCATANVLVDAMNGEITAGDQDWFEFAAAAGVTVTFETGLQGDNPSMDTKLYLYADDCTTELAYNDDGGEGYYSLITYTFDADATVYVVVTGYGASTTGLYTLTTFIPDPPPANDTCDGAIDLAGSPLYFEVDLCQYTNQYSPESGGCTGYTANGPEAVYMAELAAGDEVFFSMDVVEGNADLAIYLVTDCGDIAGSCVAGDDSGNPEEFTYTIPADGVYYLMLDTYSGCCVVGVTLNQPVATEAHSWSQVKALYE